METILLEMFIFDLEDTAFTRNTLSKGRVIT